MDPYETLGVDRSAGPDDIKRAYRDAAKRHHPDAGGDAEAFVAVQAAYRVLSDPERRARYDETGEIDERRTLSDAEKVLMFLAECFDRVLHDGKGLDNLHATLGRRCQAQHDDFQKQRMAADHGIRELQRLRKKIWRADDGENLFHHVLDSHIDSLTKRRDAAREGQKVAQMALDELANYRSVDETLNAQMAFMQGMGATSTSSSTTFNIRM